MTWKSVDFGRPQSGEGAAVPYPTSPRSRPPDLCALTKSMQNNNLINLEKQAFLVLVLGNPSRSAQKRDCGLHTYRTVLLLNQCPSLLATHIAQLSFVAGADRQKQRCMYHRLPFHRQGSMSSCGPGHRCSHAPVPRSIRSVPVSPITNTSTSEVSEPQWLQNTDKGHHGG